ncbi:glutamate--cysteine ligase [Allostreptomyces psammosilenae]|uniref:Glutamate--cysteine ligase n=1 Tax=Allostreptomyces psammosilenae TaxID=1892865 RepID=A0A852ZUI0_9ACTN|nr:glutamate--cysteine ligase [Allostreptomyces psammosilenae]NYI04940.1 hypothetical protein [Allostreptomyces psammosilenae]
MGEKQMISGNGLTDRRKYRERLQQCLGALATLLEEGRFEAARNLIGLELELNLADSDGRPRMVNGPVLDRLASGDFQTELAQFNLEVNIAPHRLAGSVFADLAEELDVAVRYADAQARAHGARVVMTGSLPTVTADHLVGENLSDNERYFVLNDQMMAARGEDFRLDIEGVEHLQATAGSIALEAAATSLQLHLQVTPARFADVWNAAQAIAGVQVALAANAPFLYGRELLRETRTALFEQACDVRPQELVAQGVRPRTWFGERWIDGPLDLFQENVRYFPPLLPVCSDEDPRAVLEAGHVPELAELRLHNGTVWRWNRPVYAVVRGVPHLRVENRVLPAGPTVADILANAAFYYGLLRALADSPRPVWQALPFAAAEENFRLSARDGIEAELYWPDGAGRARRGGRSAPAVRRQPVHRLVLDQLLPLARRGLDAWRIDPADRDRYLGVIEQRCLRRTNGAEWQVRTARHHRERSGLDRGAALAAMTRDYMAHAATGAPVHTWPVP